jgi:hypothetical protein
MFVIEKLMVAEMFTTFPPFCCVQSINPSPEQPSILICSQLDESSYHRTVFLGDTWVISKVLHTVRFLFKNEFILQNTFTGLQCNLHCALSQRSNVLASLVFLSGRLRC